MAKSSAMTKASGGAALVQATEDAAALAELGGLDLEETGLDEMDRTDVKLPTKAINMKGKDKDGEEIAKSAFYDTVDETQKKVVRCVILYSHKTNVWSQFDQGEGRNKIICRSDDLKNGTMRTDDGEVQRPCKDCPDQQWHKVLDEKTGEQRNVRNCNLVHNLLQYDLEEEKLFMFRAKKGALKNFMSHVNKHHFGKGKAAGLKTQDIPLFIFEVVMRAELSDDGTHALPIFERGPVLKPEQVAFMAEGLKAMKEHISKIASHSDEVGEASEAAADTSFNTEKFGGGEGQDFVEAPAGATAA